MIVYMRSDAHLYLYCSYVTLHLPRYLSYLSVIHRPLFISLFSLVSKVHSLSGYNALCTVSYIPPNPHD